MDTVFLSLFSFDITPYARRVKYSRGETIFNIGDEGGKLIYILSGETKCSYIYPEGELTVLDYAPSPAFYGELELLGVQKYTSLVEAVTESEAYIVDTSLTRERLLSDAVFLRNLASYCAKKLLRVNMQMSFSVSFPLRRRLASYILSHEENGVYSMSHTETAKYLCVTYRHLLHVLGELEKEGVILREKRGSYLITDRSSLERESIEC